MIQAVFFDWYSTLVNIDQPRAEQYISIFRALGFEIAADRVVRGLLRADQYLTGEERRRPFTLRTRDERAAMYTVYPRLILEEAGQRDQEELAVRVRDLMREQRREPRPVFVPALFDDVFPALEALKVRGLVLGIISNASRELKLACEQAGLMPYLDVLMTSQAAGARKPEQLIFQRALQQAGIKAGAAFFIGDQYESDVLGARNAGLHPLLIDRYNLYPDISECPRLRNLGEIMPYLE
jgi:putative hydrolase of the HAD superfamily